MKLKKYCPECHQEVRWQREKHGGHAVTCSRRRCTARKQEVAKPWGTGWDLYECQNVVGHRGEHLCGGFRWNRGRDK